MEPVVKVRENVLVLLFSMFMTLSCVIIMIVVGIVFYEMPEAVLIYETLLGVALLLCVLAIIYYFRRRLIVYPGYLVYYPMFKAQRTVYFHEIKNIVMIRERIFLYGAEEKVLASFENNMDGSGKALDYIKEYRKTK